MSLTSHLSRKFKQLLYRTGLLLPFAQIDRHRYLRRLKRSNFVDSRYLSLHDRAQFTGSEVVVRVENQGVFSYFHCHPKSSIEGLLLAQGFFQQTVFETLSAFVRPGTLVLDIGANIGAYTIPLARTYPTCEIHGFEPNPTMVTRLRENLALNCLGKDSNIQVKPVALSESKGQMTLYAVPQIEGNPGLSSLRQESLGATDFKAISVAVETLDDLYVGATKAISVIKIDVQGHELQVLRGGRQLLAKHRPALVFEHEDSLFTATAEAHSIKQEMQAFLAEVGYEAYYISRFGADLLTRVNWMQPLNGDLLALPKADLS